MTEREFLEAYPYIAEKILVFFDRAFAYCSDT